MGDNGNAVNTAHNLSPWRVWIHTMDKILVLDEILSEIRRRGVGGENTWLTEFQWRQ